MSTVTPGKMNEGFSVANIRAAARILSAGTQLWSAAFSGVQSLTVSHKRVQTVLHSTAVPSASVTLNAPSRAGFTFDPW